MIPSTASFIHLQERNPAWHLANAQHSSLLSSQQRTKHTRLRHHVRRDISKATLQSTHPTRLLGRRRPCLRSPGQTAPQISSELDRLPKALAWPRCCVCLNRDGSCDEEWRLQGAAFGCVGIWSAGCVSADRGRGEVMERGREFRSCKLILDAFAELHP